MFELTLSKTGDVEVKAVEVVNHKPPIIYCNMPDCVLFARDEEVNPKKSAFNALREAGFTPFGPLHILTAAHVIMEQQGLEMPECDVCDTSNLSKAEAKRIVAAQGKFVDTVLSSLEIVHDGNNIRYLYAGLDITNIVESLVEGEIPESIRQVRAHPAWLRGTQGAVRRVVERDSSTHPIAIIDSDVKRVGNDKLTPVVSIMAGDHSEESKAAGIQQRRKADIVISYDSVDLPYTIKEVSDRFTELRQKRDKLQSAVKDGTLRLEPQFQRDQWPSHPVMKVLKDSASDIVKQIVADQIMNGTYIPFDSLDLLYQTLFRATTLPIQDVFIDGEVLEQYLQSAGAYSDWRNILTLDPNKVRYQVNTNLVRQIAEEQLAIIRRRVQSTNLPVDFIVGRHGIFGEAGWRIEKVGKEVLALKGVADPMRDIYAEDIRRLSFCEVDPALAQEFHRVFHYIHTPRAGIGAFGLFLEGEDLPFSVVAFDQIDRAYKHETLLMHGYDPTQCIDLARLYSRPGTPFNTSSAIFTLAFSYFRENRPELQAVLSAFMPSYAHGMSMISAGFDDGVLIKKGGHTFGKVNVDGQESWEHLTKRRVAGANDTIQSQWPLLPVMELMAPLQPPRFTPFPEVKGKMVAVGC